MGTWGYYNFDNDAAADFAADFRDNHSEVTLLEALVAVAEEEETIEAEAASEALAAAEIVAAILGKPSRDFPADLIPVIVKLDASESADLRELAQQAVQAVTNNSELQQLWSKNEAAADWQHTQQDLLHRLT
ncbi:conserved hypothetical protein [Hymenobacter roseosalivarius DSM 11622]|uniref:DUF4259 domain-containing protein n=1 Tax=Hymenobacter roseosalivarius DSM 11622 TaxID=645990 RepID=A0A1W1W297_9BACT|nr:DUF4259 domain-containing protein [Hymenobacter roseosalivarius]SMB99224.1 conserved hypothetical protein [Hymenobacter roseosalivarius DSM 11622]